MEYSMRSAHIHKTTWTHSRINFIAPHTSVYKPIEKKLNTITCTYFCFKSCVLAIGFELPCSNDQGNWFATVCTLHANLEFVFWLWTALAATVTEISSQMSVHNMWMLNFEYQYPVNPDWSITSSVCWPFVSIWLFICSSGQRIWIFWQNLK